MAVTTINERFAERRSESFFRGGQYARRHERVFDVHTDDMDDGPQRARLADLSASGGLRIPRVGEVFPTDAFAHCRGVLPSPANGDPFHFVVVCTYSSEREIQTGGERPGADPKLENPLDRPAVYNWSYRRVMVPATKWFFVGRQRFEQAKTPIESSAGESFDPPLMQEESRPVLTVQRNEGLISPADLAARLQPYVDAINSNQPCFGYPEHHVRLVGVQGGTRFEAGIGFWSLAYEFHIMPRESGSIGWIREVLDQGFMQLPETWPGGRKPPPVNILDVNGNPVASPVKLNGEGRILEPGKAAVYLRGRTYKLADFSQLGL